MCRKGGLGGKERWDETEEGWKGKIKWIRLKAIEGGMDNFIVAVIWKRGEKKWYVSWRSDEQRRANGPEERYENKNDRMDYWRRDGKHRRDSMDNGLFGFRTSGRMGHWRRNRTENVG